MKTEYAIWGKRKGVEDIVRINGMEVQNSKGKAIQIKNILSKRGDFESVRIQAIDRNNFDMKSAFIGGIKKRR